MKRIYAVIFILTLVGQIVFSQDQKRNMVNFITWDEANQMDVSLNSRSAGEAFKTHLKISKDYEFRNQIIMGTKDQTRERDDELGYVRERYDQYYKGIKVEHADIRMHYRNDTLVWVNGGYIDVPTIDIAVSVSKEAAIQKAKEHIGAKKYIWEDKSECDCLKSNMENVSISCYPEPETVIYRNTLTPEDTLFHVAYKMNIRALEPFSHNHVFVDAKTGKILNTVSKIYFVNGTVATRYSETRTISTQQNGAVYRLRDYDNSRSIETYNMQNGSSYNNTDNDNNWTAVEFHNANSRRSLVVV